MAECGVSVQLPGMEICTSGCLVTHSGAPNKVFMLSVCHGLTKKKALVGDAVVLADGSNRFLGRLWSWTGFTNQIKADVSLTWIDPSVLSPNIAGLGAPTGLNLAPALGQNINIYPGSGTTARQTTIERHEDILVDVTGPDWFLPSIDYLAQIVSKTMFSEPGDSGAIVLDDNKKVVGMVVAVEPSVLEDDDNAYSHSVVTPFSAIWQHPDLRGQLTVLSAPISNPLVPTSP